MNGIVSAPVIDGRRRAALLAMLEQLVPACLPDWRAGGGQGDVAQAILSIAASLEAEVTQRLDRVPEKQFRNFLDWIGIHRDPARAARLYVVLLTAPGAPATVLAPPRLRLQAQVSSGPIVFETDQDMLVVPGSLTDLVAVDGMGDKLYLPFPGLLTAAAPDSLPRVRALAGPARAGAMTVQVTPALGLAAGQSIGIGGAEYRITDVKNDLVSIDPALNAAAAPPSPVAPVTSLIPFPPGQTGDTAARNWQRHELYIGATDLLDIDSDASIVVRGGDVLFGAGITWKYWGLAAGASNPDWLAFEPTPGAGTLTLAKQVPSTLPPTTLFGNNARWLRAVADAPAAPISLTDGLSVLVTTNPSSTSPVTVDAFANSVPLVTTTEFFPLGREPRLFDQFYVSAPEAMTKRGATVTLHFTAADESLGPLAPAAGAAFAVRNDGAFVQLSVTSDAINRNVVTAPTVGEQARAVSFDPRWPPSIANYAWFIYQFLFAAVVSDDQQVWLWRGFTFFGGGYQPLSPNNGWVSLGAPAGTTVGPVAVALETGANVVVLAAVDGILHTRALGSIGAAPPGAWQAGAALPLDTSGVSPKVVQIAAARWPAATQPEQIVLVDEKNALWHLSDANDSNATPIAGTTAHVSVAPAVIWDGASDPVIVTADATSHPIAVTTQGTIVAGPLPRQLDIEDRYGNVGVLTEPQSDRSIALFRPSDSPHTLVVWPLDDTPLPDEPITDETDLRGAPVAVRYPPVGPTTRTVLLVPGSNLAVYSRDWISPPDVFAVAQADLGTGVQLSLPPLTLGPNEGDSLLESLPIDPAQRSIYRIEDNAGIGGTHVFRPGSAFSANVGPDWRLLILSVSAPNGGIRSGHLAGSVLTLDAADTALPTDVILMISGTPPHYESAKSFTLMTVAANTATLDRAPGLDGIPDGAVTYQHVRVSPTAAGSLVPTLANVPQAKVPTLLARGLTSNGTPAAQSVQGSASGVPFLVLSPGWTTPPVAAAGRYTFHIPPAQSPGAWVADQQPVVPNPELSWEYWNGRSWLHIDQLVDGTRNLVQSGPVTFPRPIDMAPTDVAGKNQPWVRARLIGGDYGKEIYKLTGSPGQSQTAERDTSQIHPPRMLGLTVGYTLTTAQEPDFLLTFDSLGLRDQSAANRLSGAKVTAFQPVADMLADFGPDEAAPGSRALFLGITAPVAAPPENGVIRLLAFVREQPGQVRLIAETLRDGQFVELPLTDDTGGLGQDGLLSIALDAPLQLATLFGNDRYWLRLRAREDDPGRTSWQPVLEGLYLNAASATAAETQDFEILGSSDGSPSQRVTLARPPVLEGSLDLRVREPLADEDIATLQIGDPDRVRTDIPGRQGAWVRWTEVSDVVDAGPGERAYRLDPATGDIFFGDAQAGMVPPVGRDGIAALTYRRVGTAAANQVAAWAALNLVTTLPGVEQVVAPRPAAGGADPGSDAATLADAPAALRDRGRAVTGADLEAIALGNTSELAQARYIQSGRAARLVVVATGQDPRPGKALREVLRARLASVTLPRLAAKGGLAVDPPVLRPLALTAALTVESLDVGGTVDAAARSALEQLLDPATGGVEGSGWPLGAMPAEADVMAVLVGIDGLVGVTSLVLSDVDAAGVLHAPPRVFAADELAVLAPDRLVLSLTPVTP